MKYFPVLFLILSFLIPVGNCQENDIAWRTFPFLSNSLQLTPDLNKQCFNETSLFIASLQEVAKITSDCLEYKNCTLIELTSVQDYVFAIQRKSPPKFGIPSN